MQLRYDVFLHRWVHINSVLKIVNYKLRKSVMPAPESEFMLLEDIELEARTQTLLATSIFES